MSLLWVHAMAWHDKSGTAEEVGAKPSVHAGFSGYVGSSNWYMDETGPEEGSWDEPDVEDDDLHDFVTSHGSNSALWQNKGRLGKVDISKGVFATQSHVGQKHIDRYLADPSAETWHLKTTPEKAVVRRPGIPEGLRGPNYDHEEYTKPVEVEREHYLGDEHPMFVTHEGRLHCTEGHHRVAAALQRGDKSIQGWHYDADKHGFPSYDEEHW